MVSMELFFLGVKQLGYAGIYLFFLFLLQNIDCGYSLEPPRRKNKIKFKNFQLFIARTSFRNGINGTFLPGGGGGGGTG